MELHLLRDEQIKMAQTWVNKYTVSTHFEVVDVHWDKDTERLVIEAEERKPEKPDVAS
jgi:hypothetical protein